jgi:hypothetical protein
MKVMDPLGQLFDQREPQFVRWWGMGRTAMVVVLLAACGGSKSDNSPVDAMTQPQPGLGSCTIFPANHIFNTAIDSLPVDPNSGAYISALSATRKLHLDLGQDTNTQAADYYGIPYNVVHGSSFTWPEVAYQAGGARDESDCADSTRAEKSPCPASPGALPVPSAPLVEGGINSTPGDHHMLVVDADTCRLWELDAAVKSGSQWTVYSSASWDLHSTALRPDTWTSADAGGFPILPLLLRADEASSGTITHAVRFTTDSTRETHLWPARHDAGSSTSTNVPQMGQLFRLKSSYPIPASFHTQSRAILQALKTYGMYLADNGSSWYIQGEPSASWDNSTFDEVQSVTGDQFEAVDITAITSRSGFDPNSGAVPPS